MPNKTNDWEVGNWKLEVGWEEQFRLGKHLTRHQAVSPKSTWTLIDLTKAQSRRPALETSPKEQRSALIYDLSLVIPRCKEARACFLSLIYDFLDS